MARIMPKERLCYRPCANTGWLMEEGRRFVPRHAPFRRMRTIPLSLSLEMPMPTIAADIVDAYIFRKINARIQFLLLLRRPDVSLGGTWQSVHEKIEPGETALQAAERGVMLSTGLAVTDAFSADYINQVYDHLRDTIILAPVFAFAVPPRAEIRLSEDFGDKAWCEREEATARLLWSGQRWAIRHIDEVIGQGGQEAEFYRVR